MDRPRVRECLQMLLSRAYVPTQVPNTEVAFVLDSGRNFGIAFRKEDTAFRAKVEEAVECLKTGWHPRQDPREMVWRAARRRLLHGEGLIRHRSADFEGYDATEHKTSCK